MDKKTKLYVGIGLLGVGAYLYSKSGKRNLTSSKGKDYWICKDNSTANYYDDCKSHGGASYWVVDGVRYSAHLQGGIGYYPAATGAGAVIDWVAQQLGNLFNKK